MAIWVFESRLAKSAYDIADTRTPLRLPLASDPARLAKAILRGIMGVRRDSLIALRGEPIQWEFPAVVGVRPGGLGRICIIQNNGRVGRNRITIALLRIVVQIDGNLFNRKILIWLGDRDDCIAIDRHIGGL